MPDVIAMKLFPTPPIGWPVIWYPQANSSRPELAQAATITQPGENGRVCLTTFAKAAAPRPINHCIHVICPSHKRRPETTMRNGGWDFIPGLGPDKYHAAVREGLEKYLRMVVPHGDSVEEDRIRERVLVMFSQRVSVEEIAKKVEITPERVSGIVSEVVGSVDSPSEADDTAVVSRTEVEKMISEAIRVEKKIAEAMTSAPQKTQASKQTTSTK